MFVADDVLETQVNKVFFPGGGCRVPAARAGFNLLCPSAIEELAKIYNEGEEKYPFDDPIIQGSTWLRGLPGSDTINHLINHLLIAMMGGDKEGGPITHLAKVAWGCFALIHFLKKCKHHRHAVDFETAVKEGWDGEYGKK